MVENLDRQAENHIYWLSVKGWGNNCSSIIEHNVLIFAKIFTHMHAGIISQRASPSFRLNFLQILAPFPIFLLCFMTGLSTSNRQANERQ